MSTPKMERHTGYVAFLDVLGFTSLVAGEDHAERLGAYIDCAQRAILENGDQAEVKFVLFSDSIVLTTADGTETGFLRIVQACSHLLRELILNAVPVRGAIGYGSFFQSQSANGVFVAGRPIIEAYRFEQQQNWIGVMLAPSALRQKAKLGVNCAISSPDLQANETHQAYRQRVRWMLCLQEYVNIPFHHDPLLPTAFHGFAVVPGEGGNDLLKNAEYKQRLLLPCIRAINEQKLWAPDPPAQEKYNNTLTFLGIAHRQWSDLPSDPHFKQMAHG